MENYQKGDFDIRPEVWLNGNMHEEKRRNFFGKSDAHVHSQVDAPAPPMIYCREIVLNMSVKFSRSRVQVRSGADKDG